MKIKKSEYKKRIDEAFENGLRIGLENPEYARMYLTSEKVKETLHNVAENIADAFSRLGV